jgi:WD40 repeat protein
MKSKDKNKYNNWNIYQELTGHTNEVTCVSWNLFNDYIISGSLDKTIKIWRFNSIISSYECFTSLNNNNSNGISHLIWSPNGSHILSGSTDGFIKLWKATSDLNSISNSTNFTSSSTEYYKCIEQNELENNDQIIGLSWNIRNNSIIVTSNKNRVFKLLHGSKKFDILPDDEICSLLYSSCGNFIATAHLFDKYIVIQKAEYKVKNFLINGKAMVRQLKSNVIISEKNIINIVSSHKKLLIYSNEILNSKTLRNRIEREINYIFTELGIVYYCTIEIGANNDIFFKIYQIIKSRKNEIGHLTIHSIKTNTTYENSVKIQYRCYTNNLHYYIILENDEYYVSNTAFNFKTGKALNKKLNNKKKFTVDNLLKILNNIMKSSNFNENFAKLFITEPNESLEESSKNETITNNQNKKGGYKIGGGINYVNFIIDELIVNSENNNNNINVINILWFIIIK